jgi:hypothetical protein
MKDCLLVAFGFQASCGYQWPSEKIAYSDELCRFLADESAGDPLEPTVVVTCVEFGYLWRGIDPIPVPASVSASIRALEEAAAVCNDGCSLWMHRSCEVVEWDTGEHPEPSCDIAVDCLMRWRTGNECDSTIYVPTGERAVP